MSDLRIITNEEAAALPQWETPFFIRSIAPVFARSVGPWDLTRPLPNGERPQLGQTIILDTDKKPRYCLPTDKFLRDHERVDSDGDSQLFRPKPTVQLSMILLDEPFHLLAHPDWAKDGHQGWRVTTPFMRSSLDISGYPIVKTRSGYCHSDPNLWDAGAYAVIAVPTDVIAVPTGHPSSTPG